MQKKADPGAGIKSGDYRRGLEALRDVLADALIDAPPAMTARVAGRLQALLVEIHRLDVAERLQRPPKADEQKPGATAKVHDEFAQRRQQRKSAASRRRAPRRRPAAAVSAALREG